MRERGHEREARRLLREAARRLGERGEKATINALSAELGWSVERTRLAASRKLAR